MVKLQVVGNTLDQLFEDLFRDKTKKEQARLKKKYSSLETLAKADRRIERIVRDIVDHYMLHIRPNGFKAQIVASDRETAVKYKEFLDKLIFAERSVVVMTVNSDDPKECKEKYKLTRENEKSIKEAFIDPNNPLEFLIVCDKLLTGFDAPIEQVMYLDQRLREHTLLQAVARTNRTYPRKNYGLVVDYVGVGKELAEALVIFDKEDLEGVLGTEDIKKELGNLDYWHKAAMKYFAKVNFDNSNPEDVLQECMEILKPADVRAEFDAAFREFAKSMDFLMPDPMVNPFVKDFKLLGAIREGAKNLYRDDRLELDECSKKVENLIHIHIRDAGIADILTPIYITAPDFHEQLEIKGNARAKASHVEHGIRQTITEKVSEDPVFYSSLKDQLEAVIEEDKKGRKDEAKLLLKLMELTEQEARREAYAKSLGFDDVKEVSFFGLLQPIRESMFKSDEEQVGFTKDIIETIKELSVIDWIDKDDIKREMRKKIRRKLKHKGCPKEKIESLIIEIMSLAGKHFRDY